MRRNEGTRKCDGIWDFVVFQEDRHQVDMGMLNNERARDFEEFSFPAAENTGEASVEQITVLVQNCVTQTYCPPVTVVQLL